MVTGAEFLSTQSVDSFTDVSSNYIDFCVQS